MSSYATPVQFRDRFMQAGDDSFASYSDDELDQALIAASAEIDGFKPYGDLTNAAMSILAEKCFLLARMLVYQNQALSEEHPVVRDALAVRRWLELLARKIVILPDDSSVDVGLPVSRMASNARVMVIDSTYESLQDMGST